MSKKYTLEYVKEFFKEQECELLEKEYKNNSTKMRYRCSCGDISEIIFKDFIRGQRCMKCKGSEKLTFDYVYNYFKEHNCELLEKEYKNNHALMKYRCSCGNISKITFNDFKQGHKCSTCGKSKKYTLKYIKQYFRDHGCELLEKKYVNNSTKMRYR